MNRVRANDPNPRRPGARPAVLVLLAATALGCASTTRFVSTWQEPTAQAGALAGKKVAVFTISDNQAMRRVTESVMAREITERGAQGVAGNTLMSAEETRDQAAAAAKLRQGGFGAVVTMRGVGTRERTNYNPGTLWIDPGYQSWGGYWTASWAHVYTPGYMAMEMTVMIETLIYDLETGQLLWAGRSDTTDPSSVEQMIEQLASELDGELAKSGLLR